MLEFRNMELSRENFSFRADFNISQGRRVAVIGPSGAGKSTLLSLIAGFETPDRGTIFWQGDEITKKSPSKRPVSMVFQDNNLFPHLSVTRNVALGLSQKLRLSGEDHEEVARALDKVGLTGFAGRKPGELSGGQQSRVALARTLVQKRPILLLDEPFSALGPGLKTEMLDLFGTLAQETELTVLMVTHDPQDARKFAQDTILVDRGFAQPPVATETLFANPPESLRDYIEGSVR